MDISQQPRSVSRAADPVDCAGVAAALFDAYTNRKLIEAPTRALGSFSKADALEIAERVRALRIAAGAKPVGYKVGFTNGAVRTQFDAAGPLAATVYDGTLAADARIDAKLLLGPRIEPEVVVGLGANGTIAWAALGFEIVQSHVADWNFGYLDAIADFGLHAALVIGEKRPIDDGGAAALASMRVQLRCDGEVVERGAGSDVDGGALGSVCWLRDDLRRVGRELEAGEIVSTGSMTRVPKITSGQRWTIEALDGELAPLTIDVD
jgi:2-oxo-3-hexenedioate decarboxylase